MIRCADDTLYTGVAKDLSLRISRHNAGEGAKYTRGRRPVTLVYQEDAPDYGSALRREYEIKQMTPVEKKRLIAD
jgi:predicted GIY-YIG superfamily endonuclease